MTHFQFYFQPKRLHRWADILCWKRRSYCFGWGQLQFFTAQFPKNDGGSWISWGDFLVIFISMEKSWCHIHDSQPWWTLVAFPRWLSQQHGFVVCNSFNFLSTPCREVTSWDISLEMMDSDFGEHLRGFSIKDIWEREYCVNSTKGMYMGSFGESTPQMDRWILTILVVKKNGRLIYILVFW